MLSLPMSFLDFPFVLWIHPKAAYESYWTIRRPWMEAIKLIVFIQFIHHIPGTGLS
jgi:hypothetical protein